MAGNHFKNGDGEPLLQFRRVQMGLETLAYRVDPAKTVLATRTSPGETAMFAALYEQSQKAKQAGRVGRQCHFRSVSGSAASVEPGLRPVPTGGANVAGSTGPANNAHARPQRQPHQLCQSRQ